MIGVSHYVERMFEVRTTRLGVLVGVKEGGHTYLRYGEIERLKEAIRRILGQVQERLQDYGVWMETSHPLKTRIHIESKLDTEPISLQFTTKNDSVIISADGYDMITLMFAGANKAEVLSWEGFFEGLPHALNELEHELEEEI